MRTPRAPDRLATLFTALAAVLAISAAPASAQVPAPEGVLDHFRCYSPEAVGDPIGPLGLRDQFGSDTVLSASPSDLCNPVQKTVIEGPPAPPLLNPDAHLVCYDHEPGVFEPRAVRVSNQFGEDTLQVLFPDRLCVPASKAVELPDGSLPEPPPLGDIEQRLDHFRCYVASGTFGPPPVLLEDQFGTSQAFFGSAARLCNPVEKQRPEFPVTPIGRPFAHLVCYPFFAQPPGSAPNVATGSQFGTVQFFSISTQFGELCVPSLKEEGPPPRVAQHFRLYRAVGGPATLEPLTLVDQFGTQRVRLGAVRLLATPVEKRREGREPEPIQRPDEHLRCYRIAGAEVNRTVTISNQFRDATVVTVGKPTDLCAPASKVFEGEPGPPPTDLNHYKCYAVSRTPSVAEDITLADQFGSEQVRVQRLSRLCNPVEKRRDGREPEPPPHPAEHLACYQIRELAPFEARNVFTSDQFLTEPLEITKPSRLCVPSEKVEGGGV